MSFSIEPAYTVSSELMRQLTRASTNIVNQWFFLEGTFSTLAKIIFDEIGAGDKQGFLNKYSDYEICYGEEYSSLDKNITN